MDCDLPSTTTAFNKLPIELNKNIAHYLETDKDIANFSFICKATNHAIDGDHGSFWRSRWRETFALIPGKTNKELKRNYQNRARNLNRGRRLLFIRGHSKYERRLVRVLIELINESWQAQMTVDNDGALQCPNILALKKFVEDSQQFFGGKRPPPAKDGEPKTVHSNLAAVRLMCAHFLFGQDMKQMIIGIDDSQKAVYAPTNREPIYLGERLNEINMEWCFHCFNFFHYYMAIPEASMLHEAIQDLDECDKPTYWCEPLKPGTQPLSRCWKGTYAYLDPPDIRRIRQYATGQNPTRAEDAIFSDLNVEDGIIQSIEFNFHKDTSSVHWPEAAEQRLHSQRETLFDQTRAQHSKRNQMDPNGEATKNVHITGWGEDAEDTFYMTGWLNPLPDQSGIPGWQRITLIKHFQEELDLTQRENHWAYEGVVLPGGKIILGRWWYASDEVDFDNDYSGPFILWAVESEPTLYYDDEDVDDA